jgi:hypothetical protein
MRTDRWLDTQRGRLARSSVTRAGRERVEAGGAMIEADRFRLEGDLTADLWYDSERWVRLAFAGPDGSAIRYVLQPPGTPVAMLTP